MWTALIGPISSLAGSFIEGQVSKQKAKANLAQTEAEAKAEVLKTAATHDSKCCYYSVRARVLVHR